MLQAAVNLERRMSSTAELPSSVAWSAFSALPNSTTKLAEMLRYLHKYVLDQTQISSLSAREKEDFLATRERPFLTTHLDFNYGLKVIIGIFLFPMPPRSLSIYC